MATGLSNNIFSLQVIKKKQLTLILTKIFQVGVNPSPIFGLALWVK